VNFKQSIIILFYFSSTLCAKVSGIVLDQLSSKPVQNVNIISGEEGTTTNAEGEFYINVIDGTELKFSHIGYQSITLPVYNHMSIVMIPSVIKSDEIIVHAGLTEESLQTVASSISVVTSENIKLSAADHFQSLTERISNLNWSGGTSRPRYFQIRGIGERSHYFGEGQPNFSVGFVLDDMDLSGLGMIGHLYDIDQIEIYKGPQSFLYGANALAGLISIQSKDPTNKNEFGSSISYGSDNHHSIKTYFNLKIIEKLSLRFMVNYNYTDGFRDNLTLGLTDTNKKKEKLARMKLYFNLSDRLNVLATFIHSNLDNGYDAWAPDNNLELKTYSDDKGKDSQKTFGYSFNTNFKVNNNFRFKSITSYTETDLIHSFDSDWADSLYWAFKHGWTPDSIPDTVFFFNNKFNDRFDKTRSNFTQELRSYLGKFIVGLYFKQLNEMDEADGYIFGGDATHASGAYNFRALAGYTQYSIDITSHLRFKANFRIEQNKHNYNGTFQNYDYYNSQSYELEPIHITDDDNVFGYLTSLTFFKNKKTRYYGSFSQGYKSGGINQQPHLIDVNRLYSPEFIQNLEFGLKRKNDNNKINFAVFWTLRKNQQVSISNQVDKRDPNSFLFYTGNAGNGKVNGMEIDCSHKIHESLLLQSSFSLLNTYLDKFYYPAYSSNGNLIEEYGGGREASMAPKTMGSIGIGYIKSNFYCSINTSYKNEYYYSDSHDQKSEPYFLTNIVIGKSITNFEVKFWIRNIFDKRYAVRGFYFGLIPPDYPNQLYKSYGDPRHFGVTINCNL